jgi:uncharacterized protein (DUF1800 family)
MCGALEAFRPGIDGAWDRAAAAHLLRRAGFGGTRAEIERAAAEGLDATLARLLEPPGHDATLHASIRSLLATGELESLQAWWMALILGGGDPLRERMALVWHAHFATSHDKVGDVRLMHAQNELFRAKGLGDWRELLRAVAVDPAMLFWLDGNMNRAGHANENFAREVMELFALGIGHYTERDVLEAARAFTGWGVEGRSFAFRAEHHDRGTKRVLGREVESGEEAIEAILAHPECPRHVARRLARELVGPHAGCGVVEAVAGELVAREWNIAGTVEAILRSRAFFAPDARRSRIAAPVEIVASTVRALGAHVPPREAARAAARMGQALFRPPSVKGWDGGRAWIDAGTWIARHDCLAKLALASLEPKGGVRVDLAAALGAPESIDEVLRRANEVLLDGRASDSHVDLLRRVAHGADSLERALAETVAAVLVSPEYHFA